MNVNYHMFLFEKSDIIFTDKFMIVKEDADNHIRLSEITFDGPWAKIANMILAKTEIELTI